MKNAQHAALLDAVRLLVATRGLVEFQLTGPQPGKPYPPRFEHKRGPKRRGRRQCATVKR